MSAPIDDRRSWSIKKELNLGEILTTLVMLVTVLIYITTISADVKVNRNDIQAIKEVNIRQDADNKLAEQQRREDYKALDDKLSRVLELLGSRR